MRLSITHFVITSVLAHLVLVATWAGTQSQTVLIPSSSSSAPVFNVALNAETMPVTHAHALRSDQRENKSKEDQINPSFRRMPESSALTYMDSGIRRNDGKLNTQRLPQHKTEPIQHHQVSNQETADITPTASAPDIHPATPHLAEFHRSEIRDRVLSRIRNNLQQYFVYPLLAQRQGWQGRVMLGFSVEADGMIRNIHIAAGSGYPILDISAVDALSRVHHLYEASDWLQGKRLDLQMPVIFRLQGG